MQISCAKQFVLSFLFYRILNQIPEITLLKDIDTGITLSEIKKLNLEAITTLSDNQKPSAHI